MVKVGDRVYYLWHNGLSYHGTVIDIDGLFVRIRQTRHVGTTVVVRMDKVSKETF